MRGRCQESTTASRSAASWAGHLASCLFWIPQNASDSSYLEILLWHHHEKFVHLTPALQQSSLVLDSVSTVSPPRECRPSFRRLTRVRFTQPPNAPFLPPQFPASRQSPRLHLSRHFPAWTSPRQCCEHGPASSTKPSRRKT